MAIFADDLQSCTSCGACCFFDPPDYLRVLNIDYERLGERANALTQLIEGRTYMRQEGGHCIALCIEPDGAFLCSIYEDRPDVCRSLERGSGLCRAEVMGKSHLPQAALVTLRRARAPIGN